MKFKPDIFSVQNSKMGDNPSLPFCFHPVLIFSNLVNALSHRLRTDGTNVSTQIIVDDGRYIGSATDVLMNWEPWEPTIIAQ